MDRVLLVDDDPAILRLLAKIVSSRGWEAVQARSGHEALERLDGAELVVTDLTMPGMDGLELLATIREREPNLPVILVTGHCADRLFERAIAAGAHTCLGKPFGLDELVGAVASALAASRRRRVAPVAAPE